jgi:large subunit ribosomal protein L24
MKIKKGDNILIISGKDKGKTGKVLRAFPKMGKILAEGLNLRKKTVRPKREGEKGQIISQPFSFNVSNAKMVCPRCGKATRVGYKIDNKEKHRICKKCQSII